MGYLFSLFKGLLNTILLLVALLAVVAIFAWLSTSAEREGRTGILIEPGPGQPRPIIDPAVQPLQATLEARATEINTPLSDDPTPISITIENGETAQSVAEKLEAMGLISDARLFTQLLHYNGLDTRLQVGQYQLRPNMNMRQIGSALYRGWSIERTVHIPPGWRMEQLAEHLSATGLMDGRLFLQQARLGQGIHHPLLADRPAGLSYEGYLFPGAYVLPEGATPADLISRMLTSMARHLPADAPLQARRQGLTFHQALTLASIVEREAALASERPLIASVYLNRLKPDSSEPHLRADPTVQYALGYQPLSGQWWKAPLTAAEYTAVDSPYNTYLYPGLPPGPIASPGADSILAVLQPAQTDYLFFVCRRPGCEGGEHVFAKTYQEHLQNARIYWESDRP